MYESMLALFGPTIVVLLLAGAALYLLAVVVVVVSCLLGLGTEVCRAMRSWLVHGHQ